MPRPPPRPDGLPRSVAEPNVSNAPHTPIPDAHAAPTEPPPAMRMDPPRALAMPRTRVGSQPLLEPAEHEPPRVGMGPPAQRDELAELRARGTSSERPPSRGQWKSAVFKFLAAVTAFLGAVTVLAELYAGQIRQKQDNTEAKVQAQETVTKPLPEAVDAAALGATKCRAWARDYDDYNRQIWARFGVAIPKQPNALPSTTVEFSAPRAKARVTGGIILEVKTPPPPLP